MEIDDERFGENHYIEQMQTPASIVKKARNKVKQGLRRRKTRRGNGDSDPPEPMPMGCLIYIILFMLVVLFYIIAEIA